jgi:alkanesulfonate monooxygenase SsuD/methylene tetrahydromethanopterin reductase-like flavin-dependent oxidoreductase (luciferase family)
MQLGNGSRYPIYLYLKYVLIDARNPKDIMRTKDRLGHWLWLAKLAEKGKITSIFLSNSYAGHSIYNDTHDTQYQGGSHVGKLDPFMTISAMAAVTDSVPFGITASTSYIREYSMIIRLI